MSELGLRQKMSLGFGGMLAILVIIGVQSVRHFSSLGASIDVILRENYRSVIACQRMNEALERMDREEAMGAIKERESRGES
ncbi:MAG TPA: hypothetical protein VHP61_09525 [Acidobacteriota bacterium]|nr:hypothetical protein [Acidobacteriota bacterium]